MLTATYTKLFVCVLFFALPIAAMDTPEASTVPQNIILTTLTNNAKLLSESIEKIESIHFSLEFYGSTHPYSPESAECSSQAVSKQLGRLAKLKDKMSLNLTENQQALEYHKSFLARKAFADEQAQQLKKDIQKDMQEQREKSKQLTSQILQAQIKEKEQQKQDVEKALTTLKNFQNFGEDTTQRAQEAIPCLNQKIQATQKKLEEAEKDRDNHIRRLPYICGGIIAFIVVSVYACKYFCAR